MTDKQLAIYLQAELSLLWVAYNNVRRQLIDAGLGEGKNALIFKHTVVPQLASLEERLNDFQERIDSLMTKECDSPQNNVQS